MFGKGIVGLVAFFAVFCVLALLIVSNAQAVDQVFETEGNQEGSLILGFDPTINLIPAATNTDASSGPCFSCPNTSPDAGGTTAGSLTDSMFGIIRENSAANVGQEGRNPVFQGQLGIPAGPNTASAFIVQVNTPGMDFLSAGTPVGSPQPTTDLDGNPFGAVGEAGMRMDFTTTFSFDPAGGTAAVTSVEQATFTGGQSNNNVQLVRFVDSFMTTSISTDLVDGIGTDASITWNQDIKEGGFQLIGNAGSFTYNGNPLFPRTAHPTGPSQSCGSCVGVPIVPPGCIGQSGLC